MGKLIYSIGGGKMITKQKLCILSAVLCMAGVFLQPSGMFTAGAAAAVTIGYYNDVPEFQSGASDDERKSGYAYRI